MLFGLSDKAIDCKSIIKSSVTYQLCLWPEHLSKQKRVLNITYTTWLCTQLYLFKCSCLPRAKDD